VNEPESMNNSTQPERFILAVDDDPDVRATIRRVLERDHHHIIEAQDGQSALHLAREHRPDVIILDVSLPDINGFELCTMLRSMPFVNDTSILFLSVHENAQIVARALDCGGDDYMRKPFATRELTARVRALLRRTAPRQPGKLSTLQFIPNDTTVIVDGQSVVLTPTEHALLDYLRQHPTEYHSAATLLERLWEYPPDGGDTALVRNHIRNLRRKIEPDPDRPTIIVSAHGRGYAVCAAIDYPDGVSAR
jgi:DNA-binding response OmpR family regulator